MFRLEKVFQNDDQFFVYFDIFFKSLVVFFTIYIFSILESNSIYDLKKTEIYYKSKYYYLSIYLPILFYFLNFIALKNKKKFEKNLKKVFKDVLILFVSIFLILFFLILNKIFIVESNKFFLLIILIIFSLLICNIFLFKIYDLLIKSNIIQRNILLVGNKINVIKILNETKNPINVYKCCFIIDSDQINLIRHEIKIPIFSLKDDIRSILEYHHLGQIWYLNDAENIDQATLNHFINFPVDLLIININETRKPKRKLSLINGKYDFTHYEISRFYGLNLLIKIIIDKVFAIFFLILSLPILIICSILIYIEDGFPIIFFQDRTGWDGRRFKIFKLRTLYNNKYDPISQILKNDNRKLKIGKFIRQFSIDEIPQLLNIILGDMSLVGPRPHPVSLDLKYASNYKNFLNRYKANPGLTGWSQIHGFRGATLNPELMKKRMEFDLWYLKNWSNILDLYIIIRSFYAIFKYKGD